MPKKLSLNIFPSLFFPAHKFKTKDTFSFENIFPIINQIKHIKFPLEVVGLYGPDYHIEKDSWSEEYLGNSIFVGEDTFHDIKCKSNFKKKTETIYTYELKRLENLQLLRRYTFEVINGKWFLVKIEM